ncbi:MAG: hypothetical protein EPO11_06625 [Gammaproteobacteria bacterium]|nr:MAG: hypothetical protein EPO11_06625 [Gammaproteobacteria bacterium]
MELTEKDFKVFPKFRHNLWTSYEDVPDMTCLTVSHGVYEVPTEEASKFLKIRSFCTGYNNIVGIAEKSKIPIDEIQSIVDSLIEIDALHLPFKPLEILTKQEIIYTLDAATKIWSEQLYDTHISRDIFLGKTSKNVVIGWLLETYHYVKSFPDALEIASNHAGGKLKEILIEYTKQEKGHEWFILQSLLKAGLSKQEIENSIPLISTRTIDFLFKELFSLEPCAVLLVARIIEAEDFDVNSANEVAKILYEIHGFPIDMLKSFFDHVEVDSKLGHHQLLENNLKLLEEINPCRLHDIVNKLHDIKHAFDLQKLEIKDYYDKIGNYLPRQYVDFFAI